jgi:hypothetical protein
MICIKCNGTMIGDGFTSVLECENLPEYMQAGDDSPEFAAPDEGPFYCDHGDDDNVIDHIVGAYLSYFNQKWNLYLYSDNDLLSKFEYKYDEKTLEDDSILLLAEHKGLMSFMIKPSKPTAMRGACGGNLLMKAGGHKEYKDCWSSNGRTVATAYGIDKPLDSCVDQVSAHISLETLKDLGHKLGFLIVDGRVYPHEDFMHAHVCYGIVPDEVIQFTDFLFIKDIRGDLQSQDTLKG